MWIRAALPLPREGTSHFWSANLAAVSAKPALDTDELSEAEEDDSSVSAGGAPVGGPACAANGVTEIMEVRIGYDGIVFASQIDGPALRCWRCGRQEGGSWHPAFTNDRRLLYCAA